MGNFSFIEYTYNPDREPGTLLTHRLMQLGFAPRSQHNQNDVKFWSQESCIVMVRADSNFRGEGKVSGLGLVTDKDTIASVHNSVPCTQTGFFKVSFPKDTFTFYLIEDQQLQTLANYNYTPIASTNDNTVGLDFISGVEFCAVTTELVDFMKKVGFTEQGNVLLSPNKRFTAVLSNKPGQSVRRVICETPDVFVTTAKLIANHVTLLQFEDNEYNDFENLTHKIRGYNCVAFGKYNSYSIENYILADSFNTDIVFRSRRQFLKISTEGLDYYDSVIADNCSQ